ncbi:putative nuclease HARBI1 isoform X2 [Hyperolius riggenbachi]|uniref:putative nuclease HARBI1 isoform X2 n=1 Tax=Hyperolius riggenbachi TaxID=752182 RepID=UPI0035A391AA
MDPFTCSYAVFMRNRRRLYGPYMRGFSASSPAPQSVFTGRSLFSDRATEELYAQMGLNQRVVDVLYAELRPYLEPSTRAGRPFTGMTKLLCGLWFLANGSDQKSSSLALGISQSTFSHIIKAFLKGMRSILCKYIAIPSTDQEWESIKKRFYAIACIPNTVGVIDFKHVYFKIPGYLKGYPNHVTLQLICDPNLRILNMAARCPGYDSDSSIFYNSNIYNIFQDDLSEKGWLLGFGEPREALRRSCATAAARPEWRIRPLHYTVI